MAARRFAPCQPVYSVITLYTGKLKICHGWAAWMPL
jgi:hypothetical protein